MRILIHNHGIHDDTETNWKFAPQGQDAVGEIRVDKEKESN